MYQYFAFNIVYSLIVFMYLYSLKTAPFRVRFRFVLLAMISWLLPYDLINSYITQGNTMVLSPTISAFNGIIKHAIVSQVDNQTFITLMNFITTMTLFGVMWFVKDILSLNIKLQQLNKQSTLYKKTGETEIHEIQSDEIFTVGLFNPKIYIGKKHLNTPFTDSITQHELQHIKSKDHLWLLLITFIQRLMWWNPIVYLLANKGRELIELSCDQACNEQSNSGKYQKDLAQILIQTNQKSNPIASHFFGKTKQNIFRIKQLSKEFKMNKKHKTLIFSTALIPFVLMLLVSTTSISSEEANSRVEIEQGERAKNEVDLTIKFNAIEYKKTTPATVSTTNLFEHRSNIKYGAVFDFIQGVNTSGEDRFYRFKATPKRIDDEKILIEFILKYTINGKEITETPSLMVLNGTRAIIALDDETDNYKFEIEVLPRF